MFAKVLAREAGVSFFSVKGSDFRSKWYGETEQNLSNIFEQGRQSAPAILFFDEIDAILTGSEGNTLGDSPEKGIRALFLTEMDGIGSSGGALVVGATNNPDSIDPAALRPGRFDKLIYIPPPDEKGREKIFRIHLRRKPLAGAIEYQKLAEMTERFSGADIADVCSKVAEQSMKESLESGSTTRIVMDALLSQIKETKQSISLESLKRYEELREKFGRRTVKSETEEPEKKEKYGWNQIGGLEHLKQELVEAVETPLKKPELYDKYKITPPKGVLFYGPPGCGKTLMAKIVASQCNAHFLSVDATKETGEGIRKWFVRARENRPSILFFDEIDSIATSRDIGMGPDQGVVPQLLVEMDGMEGLKQVVVVAATNRPDQLDTALMRPGRFDRLIYIPPPEKRARARILKIHLKGKPLAKDVNLRELAEKTENYSGADLAALCYEASMSLIRNPNRPNPKVTMQDMLSAMEKIRSSIGPEDLEYFEEMKKKYSRG
jgi:transitional endoplasmic reticulum ATPase